MLIPPSILNDDLIHFRRTVWQYIIINNKVHLLIWLVCHYQTGKYNLLVFCTEPSTTTSTASISSSSLLSSTFWSIIVTENGITPLHSNARVVFIRGDNYTTSTMLNFVHPSKEPHTDAGESGKLLRRKFITWPQTVVTLRKVLFKFESCPKETLPAIVIVASLLSEWWRL